MTPEEKAEKFKDWVPKTELGKQVLAGKITNIDDVLKKGKKIQEPEIVDYLVDLKEEIVSIRKTTRVVRAGRKFSFSAAVLIGDGNSIIGLGTAKDKERLQAIRKAAKKARLNIIKVQKGCGSWECQCGTKHSIPFKTEGKSGSVKVILMPAPKGTGLVVGKNIKPVLQFAGIKDVWSKTFGATDTRLSFIRAAINALKNINNMKLSKDIEKKIKGE